LVLKIDFDIRNADQQFQLLVTTHEEYTKDILDSLEDMVLRSNATYNLINVSIFGPFDSV
jgi:hypothetical protein